MVVLFVGIYSVKRVGLVSSLFIRKGESLKGYIGDGRSVICLRITQLSGIELLLVEFVSRAKNEGVVFCLRSALFLVFFTGRGSRR